MAGVTDYELAREYQTVNYYRNGGAAKLELNRPGSLNALDEQLSTDLQAALDEVAVDPAVRAVLLAGAGRGFSSGADLSSGLAEQGPPDLGSRLAKLYHPIIRAVRVMPKPVVSAVHGAAAGVGLSLALACDLVVAAESGYFLLAFVNIGLVPDGGSSLFVPSRIGFARAAEMAMLGERISAKTALEWGLINRVWPDDEFAARSDELISRLAEGPTRSYAGIKRELNSWLYDRMEQQLEVEAGIQQELGRSADFAAGVAAFRQKQRPRFTGA